MQQVKFCVKCGSKVEEGNKFCASCGWKVPEVPQAGVMENGQPQYHSQYQPQYQPQYPGNPYQSMQNKKKTRDKWLGIGAVAVVVLTVVLFFLLRGSGIKPEQLNGDWEGAVTLTHVSGTDAEDARDSIGESEDLSLSLKLNADGSGIAFFDGEFDSGSAFAAKYSKGKIKINMEIDGAKGVLNAKVSKEDFAYRLKGTLELKEAARNNALKATIEAVKPLDVVGEFNFGE